MRNCRNELYRQNCQYKRQVMFFWYIPNLQLYQCQAQPPPPSFEIEMVQPKTNDLNIVLGTPRHAKSLNSSATKIWIYRNFRKLVKLRTHYILKKKNDLQHYRRNYKKSRIFRPFRNIIGSISIVKKVVIS